MSPISRRAFIGAAGAGVAGATVAGVPWQGLAGGPVQGESIVLVVIDSLRADHLGCYGNSVVRTPNIDALARESIRFDRVFPEAMPTVPARRSILTGRRTYPFRGWHPWEAMAGRPGWQPIFGDTPTLIAHLRDAGYWTTYVSDNPFLTYSPSFEQFRASLDRYVSVPGQRDERFPSAEVPLSEVLHRLPEALRRDEKILAIRRALANNGRGVDESETAAARVFATAADELVNVRRQPFLMVVDSFSPHEPWVTPRKYVDLYGDPDYRGIEPATVDYGSAGYMTPAELERLRAIYSGTVTMVDSWLGRFLSAFHDAGLADVAALALVADHGILLGERGYVGKGDHVLHPELIRVPMLVRLPGGRGGATASDYYADTTDLAPTLVSLAGARVPESAFDGVDLSPIARGRAPAQARPFKYGGYSNFTFLHDGRWKLIARNDDQDHQLYDLRADPEELADLAATHPDVVGELFQTIVDDLGRPPPRYGSEQLAAPPRHL